MEVAVPSPSASTQPLEPTQAIPPRSIRGGRGRRPWNQSHRERSNPSPSQPEERQPREGGNRHNRRPRKQERDITVANPAQAESSQGGGEGSKQPRNSRPRNAKPKGDVSNQNDSANDTAKQNASVPPSKPNRRNRFNAKLTEASNPSEPEPGPSRPKPPKEKRPAVPKGDDLTSRLIHSVSTYPYPDCPICFASIHPGQPTWSCSPSTDQSSHCCWTVFHLKCIRPWAMKSVTDFVEAWRVRGEERKGEWRCPGCQSKRETVPSGYRCFCGAQPDPKPPRLATPHSCANSCSRKRACGHACPISCHPGPCPPCQVVTELPCHCGSQTLAFKCAKLGTAADSLSCGKICQKKLNCGNHSCSEVCHEGECEPCQVKETVKCYCGKEEKEVPCGEGEAKVCVDPTGSWTGRYACANQCNRPFDCGVHHCALVCHPPSPTPPPCPQSPSRVTHCPCGKHTLTPESEPFFPPQSASQLVRSSCSDPIPTCNSTCLKPLPFCSHACANPCHVGPCPPCSVMVVRPCRCGATKHDIKCSELQAESGEQKEIICDKPCTALRACGHHQCNRLCCPLASVGATKGKGKSKKRVMADDELGTGPGGLHECDLICDKPLSCGLHSCEQRDHRGPCPPCLRSSFEEMVCHCGRTVLEPPIPCGTKIECSYPCDRPPPACGHPRTPHSCHEDPTPCPPCFSLTRKLCACGKKEVGNVKCSQEKVSCGTVCAKTLSCGFHRCEKLCHGDDCGTCTAECGKPRKLCLPDIHPCTDPCHAPSACAESEPCQSLITLFCPCGRLKQAVRCGKSITNPSGRSHNALKCSNECAIAKRNARLAEALGINPAEKEKATATWKDDLVAFGRANAKFILLVEKTFAEFVSSSRRSQLLPHMPAERRKVVYDMAAVYRIDAQMVDQEPNRSVHITRRIDTRIPNPLLSTYIQSTSNAPSPSLGKLSTRMPSPMTYAQPVPRPSPANPNRGWTSVVSQPQHQTQGSASPSAGGGWGTPRSNTPEVRTSTGTPQVAVEPRPSSRVNVGRVPDTTNEQPVAENWEDDV